MPVSVHLRASGWPRVRAVLVKPATTYIDASIINLLVSDFSFSFHPILAKWSFLTFLRRACDLVPRSAWCFRSRPLQTPYRPSDKVKISGGTLSPECEVQVCPKGPRQIDRCSRREQQCSYGGTPPQAECRPFIIFAHDWRARAMFSWEARGRASSSIHRSHMYWRDDRWRRQNWEIGFVRLTGVPERSLNLPSAAQLPHLHKCLSALQYS